MPAISTAEEAIEKAEELVSRYYPFKRLTKALPENLTWVVEFDIGVLETSIVRIVLNAETGKVQTYDKVESHASPVARRHKKA